MKVTLSVVVTCLVALGLGCGGALVDDVGSDPTDLPPDFHAAAGSLSGDDSDDDTEDGDHEDGDHEDGDRDDGDHEKGDHHKGRHGKRHRKHHLFKRLDRLDGQKDGNITLSGLPAWFPPRLLALLKAIDTDGNGAISREEAHAAWKHFHHKK